MFPQHKNPSQECLTYFVGSNTGVFYVFTCRAYRSIFSLFGNPSPLSAFHQIFICESASCQFRLPFSLLSFCLIVIPIIVVERGLCYSSRFRRYLSYRYGHNYRPTLVAGDRHFVNATALGSRGTHVGSSFGTGCFRCALCSTRFVLSRVLLRCLLWFLHI